jgi:Leucine-rich repeat (LRR) protein
MRYMKNFKNQWKGFLMIVAYVLLVGSFTACKKGQYIGDEESNIDDKKPIEVPINSIMLENLASTISRVLEIDEERQLTVTIHPNNATNKDLTWNSSNENIAIVNENGIITAISTGVVEITVNSGDKKATCYVLVIDKDKPSITMITSYRHPTFRISAEMIFIDWGDGSNNWEKFIDTNFHRFHRSYTDVQPRTIKIYGEAITGLDVANNHLTELYINDNELLTKLYCPHNLLTSLDISSAPNLQVLEVSWNRLNSLKMSDNMALEWIDVESNQLENLDISKAADLAYLNVNKNQLVTLNVSNNPALTDLNCRNNQLTSLDTSNNRKLINVNLFSNRLTSSALNDLFGTLNDATFDRERVVVVAFNDGSEDCDPTIAENKGWSVRR